MNLSAYPGIFNSSNTKQRGDTAMPELKCVSQSIHVDLKTGCDIKNITQEVNNVIKENKITIGMVNIFVIGSTGSVTTIEYEPGVVEDLKHAINTLAPVGVEDAHEKAWHDGNGHSHVQAALIGPSLTIPIHSGKMKLGTWQQLVAVNHDNHSRARKIEITITGV